MPEYQQPFDPEEDVTQLSLLALKKTREKKALSFEEVSERLKIPSAHLKALESGDIDRLPGLAFARGYLRTYGRFLGLDADALIRDFNAQYGSDSRQRVQTINRVKPQAQLSDPIIRGSLLVFVLIIIGTSVWWWQAQMGRDVTILGEQTLSAVSALLESNSSVDNDTDTLAPAPVVTTDTTSTQVGSDAVDAAQQVSSELSGTVVELVPEPQDLSGQDAARVASELEQAPVSRVDTVVSSDNIVVLSQSEAQPEAEPQAAIASRLMIRFSSECWVSIKTSDGKTIFASLLEAGDTLERELTTLPVELLIGSTDAVIEAEFRGQPLPVAERSKKGVARLMLD